jgi:electron transfer flavoprotein beta subunit
VGPQIAEKLGLPQVTYAESIKVADGRATIKRRIERGFETVECPLPLVVTVNGSADACRPRNARLVQKYKYAVTPSEKAALPADRQALVDARPYLAIKEWGVKEIEADPEQIGMAGSPTKVKTIVNVAFQAKEARRIDAAADAELEGLVKELIADHIIG